MKLLIVTIPRTSAKRYFLDGKRISFSTAKRLIETKKVADEDIICTIPAKLKGKLA